LKSLKFAVAPADVVVIVVALAVTQTRGDFYFHTRSRLDRMMSELHTDTGDMTEGADAHQRLIPRWGSKAWAAYRTSPTTKTRERE
jgi:hypothetical protein